jgi:4-carboxymuconolactone decarboxylase
MNLKIGKTTRLLAATVVAVSLATSAFAQAGPAATAQPVPVQESQTITIARRGSQPSRTGPAENFTGTVRVEPLFQATGQSRASGATVTFEPGARTAWHTHPLGQTLIVTSGVGRVQQWGGPIDEIRPGDVVRIPPGVKHWHGASPNSSMAHIAVVEPLDGKSADWMEKVSDAQYGAPVRDRAADTAPPARLAAGADGQPTRAQQLMGDINPKLAELTDKVLFGDVWERPELSQRDRSLVTVAALIAMNRPDQLRSHLARARTNGVTEEELIEVITHMAFYSGWPNAVSAIAVAREVFEKK